MNYANFFARTTLFLGDKARKKYSSLAFDTTKLLAEDTPVSKENFSQEIHVPSKGNLLMTSYFPFLFKPETLTQGNLEPASAALTHSIQLESSLKNHQIRHTQYSANDPIEDRLTLKKLSTIDAFTVSIFDGHGGSELAQYCALRINELLDSTLAELLETADSTQIDECVTQALKRSYIEIENRFFEIYEDMLRTGNHKIAKVGTCGITAIIYRNKVYVANSGDSQAIFITQNEDNYSYKKANTRLNMSNSSERERLRKEFEGIDDNVVMEERKNSYYLKGRLQPTRSIGDFYLKKQKYYKQEGKFQGPYLSCVPDVTVHEIRPNDRYMVIASDGIWDFLKKWEVVRTVMDNSVRKEEEMTNQELLENGPEICLVEETLKKSAEMAGIDVELIKQMQVGKRRNFHDDISVAIIDFKQQL